MTSTIGIPIKLLNEATVCSLPIAYCAHPLTVLSQGHQVTVEISSGQTYRGKLIEAEDNMNCQLENINVTQRDGLLPMDSPHAIAKLGLCTLFSRRQTPRSRE